MANVTTQTKIETRREQLDAQRSAIQAERDEMQNLLTLRVNERNELEKIWTAAQSDARLDPTKRVQIKLDYDAVAALVPIVQGELARLDDALRAHDERARIEIDGAIAKLNLRREQLQREAAALEQELLEREHAVTMARESLARLIDERDAQIPAQLAQIG